MRPSIPHTPASFCSPSLMHMPTKATGRLLIFSLLTALFAGLLFTPGLPGEFVFDDIPNIVNNETIQIPELEARPLAKVAAHPQLSGSMRPLPTLNSALEIGHASCGERAGKYG